MARILPLRRSPRRPVEDPPPHRHRLRRKIPYASIWSVSFRTSSTASSSAYRDSTILVVALASQQACSSGRPNTIRSIRPPPCMWWRVRCVNEVSVRLKARGANPVRRRNVPINKLSPLFRTKDRDARRHT
jgi:hypothetical protein